MNKYTIVFESNPKTEDIQILGTAIMHHAWQQKELKPLEFFAFFIRDEKNQIIAGCNGCTLYGCLYIDQLWVSASLRQQRLGTMLIESALEYGKTQKCRFATVNTFDWEALNFYQKQGFNIEFTRTGFFKNSVFYFLRKELSQTTYHNTNNFNLYPFTASAIPQIVAEFAQHNWEKPQAIFQQYLTEQENNERMIWLARNNNQFAGYITLKWRSYYPHFYAQNIPEIMDLNVLPPHRNQGLGSQLLSTAEQEAAKKSSVVGLGVGLYPDYGSAQKLYIKRGYIPDGKGISYGYQQVAPGEKVLLDDDLILWFTKKLH